MELPALLPTTVDFLFSEGTQSVSTLMEALCAAILRQQLIALVFCNKNKITV